MGTCSSDFFKSKIVVVKCNKVFTVAADFNCPEFKETVIKAVFENCKIAAVTVCYRFCESKNYAAAVTQNYNVIGIADSFSESFVRSLPFFSDTFADLIIFVACCPCSDFFIVFVDRFFNNCNKFSPRVFAAARCRRISSVCIRNGKSLGFALFVVSNLAIINFSFFYSVVKSAPLSFVTCESQFVIIVSDYEIVFGVNFRDVEERVSPG